MEQQEPHQHQLTLDSLSFTSKRIDSFQSEKDIRCFSFAQTSTQSKTSPNASLISEDNSSINKYFYFRDSDSLRKAYYSKLALHNIFNQKKFNSITLFDWDDTLLCSSYLKKHNFFEINNEFVIKDSQAEKLSKLEFQVCRLLTLSIQKSNTYIITNASQGWVEYSAMKYLPSVYKLLPQVRIISARSCFEEMFPGDVRMWKIMTFMKLAEEYNRDLIMNIICVGDSNSEIEAAQKMGGMFREAYVKTIKFREDPKIEQIIKQLNLIYGQFNSIYKEVRSITTRIEKKSK